MKIIFLNTWHGKLQNEIKKFIKEQSKNTDVFCFQEACEKTRSACRDLLTGYAELLAHKQAPKDGNFFQVIYIKKEINFISAETLFEKKTGRGLAIAIQIPLGQKNLHICNFHGLAEPGDKLDNSKRLKQSQGLINFFKNKEGLKIIGGDFNLLPHTQSIGIFEKNGYLNLIKDFKIATTRNRISWEQYADNKQYYADYVFVSSTVKVKNFSVPNLEISDHLPMILEIEI